MKGVILAGGKGTRLRPLTCNLPKPMLPLLNRPVMEYTLQLLKQHGIYEIAVTVQYMSSVIRNYFGDGSKWGVKLHYFEDSPPLGTAGSMKQAEAFLDEPFVVISGDALTDFNLSQSMQFHRQHEQLVTILVKEVVHPLHFGLAVMNEEQRIIKYIEKPSWNEVVSNTVNTGMYVMNPDIFSYIKANAYCDFSHDVFPKLLQLQKPMYGYLSEGYWLDIGTLPQYRQAHFDLLTKKADIAAAYTEVLPSVWMGEGVTLEDGTKIRGPALIGDGAVVKAGAVIEPYSCIGTHAFISEGARIRKTIIGDESFVGKHCELAGATVAHGTIIEDGAALFEKSVIGDHCHVGKNAVVKAKVKVWPAKIIDSSAVISSSVSAEHEAAASLFQRGCIHGKANVKITPEWLSVVGAAYASALAVQTAVLIGSDGNAYTELLKNVFLNSLHAAGVHTLECCYVSEASFRYGIAREQAEAGVFFCMEDDQMVDIRFYDCTGALLSTRAEKEIESIYTSEVFRHTEIPQIGINTKVYIREEEYVHTVLELLNVPLIRRARLRLLVNKLNSPFQAAIAAFFRELGCSLTWMHAAGNRSHVQQLLKSSGAAMALIFHEQGGRFELHDPDGNLYASMDHERMYVPEALLQQASLSKPLCFKQGANYTMYYIDSRTEEHGCGFEQDALYQIGKILEKTASESMPIHDILTFSPQFHLLWDEVLCPWKEKGKVMRRLLNDMQPEQFQLLDGIKFEHENGEWSYIVCDAVQPKLIIYSQSLNPAAAREKIMYLAEKIRQYQKV